MHPPEADPKVKVRILHPHFQVFFAIILGVHCFLQGKTRHCPTFSEFFLIPGFWVSLLIEFSLLQGKRMFSGEPAQIIKKSLFV